jgi:hypothetical protein
MAETRKKRPRDPIQLAKLIGDIAIGQLDEKRGEEKRGRRGGIQGGKARAIALTPEQRSEIARTAAEARWKKTSR